MHRYSLNHTLEPWGAFYHWDKKAILRCDCFGYKYVLFTDLEPLAVPADATVDQTIEAMQQCPVSTDSPFPAWVGYWSYDALARNAGIDLGQQKTDGMPSQLFYRPRTVVGFTDSETCIESESKNLFDAVKAVLSEPIPRESSQNKLSFQSMLPMEAYDSIFWRAREHILNGDTYQIKISQRFKSSGLADPLRSFQRLMRMNPSPEAFLWRDEAFSIISCSPETVIQTRGSRILTRPIGGTWDRKSNSGDPESALLSDPKETSEHNMLVDLERNDLSRVCRFGSVQIEALREVEPYAHLYHLVTSIAGELKTQNMKQVIKAMLPGGTITGCPKERTIELIDALEPINRGIYCGSFGTVMGNGDMDFNLMIRTMWTCQGHTYTQSGGGIVIDSTPEYEYNENQIKAKALLDSAVW